MIEQYHAGIRISPGTKGRWIIRFYRILSRIVKVLSGFRSHICYLYLYLVTGFRISDNYGNKKK